MNFILILFLLLPSLIISAKKIQDDDIPFTIDSEDYFYDEDIMLENSTPLPDNTEELLLKVNIFTKDLETLFKSK